MVTIYNTDLMNELKEAVKLQQGSDIVPNQLQNFIIPVIEVNPKLLRNVDVAQENQKTTTGSIVILTGVPTMDFYITSAFLSWASDAANDSTSATLVCTMEDNNTHSIIKIVKLTLTDVQQTTQMDFPRPIKIKRGTDIVASSTFSLGTSIISGGVTGYFVRNINA